MPETPRTSACAPSLPSVPTSRATRMTSAAKDAQLIDRRVDGVLELEDLAARLDGDLLREVAVGDRGRDEGDVAHLGGEVAGEQVDVVDEVLPGAREALDVGLGAELALGADLADDARDARGDGAQPAHDRLHGRAEFAESLPRSGAPSMWSDMSRERSPFATSPRMDRGLGDRPRHLLDERVDRVHGHGPRPAGAERRALRRLPFEPDRSDRRARARGRALVLLDQGVEGERDLAHHAVAPPSVGRRTEKSPCRAARSASRRAWRRPRGARGISPAHALRRGSIPRMRGLFVSMDIVGSMFIFSFRLPDASPHASSSSTSVSPEQVSGRCGRCRRSRLSWAPRTRSTRRTATSV